MATVKLYQVMMDSEIQSKTFQMGGGHTLTLANGTIIDEGHDIVKKFPSYVVQVGEKVVEDGPVLLVEEPVEVAVVEEEPVEVAVVEEPAAEVVIPVEEVAVKPVKTPKK